MAKAKRTRLTADVRRDQLVTAATELISQSGYNAFSLTGLAEACGISRAGVLFHFASKEQILLAVLAHRDQQDADAVLQTIDLDGPLDLRAALDTAVRRNLGQPEIVRLYTVLAAESLEPSHPAHEYFRDRAAESVTRFASYLGGVGRDPVELATELLAMMDGIQLLWLRDPAIDLWQQWSAYADRVLPRDRSVILSLPATDPRPVHGRGPVD